MSQAIFFKIYKGDKLQSIKQVRQSQISIGQSSDVEVCLDGENVLPWHALVEKREDGYFISDLGSPDGTYVNGKKIVEDLLKTGDQIGIGDFQIEFFIGAPYARPEKKKPSASVKPSVQDVEEDQIPEKKTADKPQKATSVVSKSATKTQDVPPEILMRKSFLSNTWKNFLPKKPAKKTFAPASAIKDLDRAIAPGKGAVVEVLVAWEERIISVYHSKKNEMVTIGDHPSAVIRIPNLFSSKPYSLVHAGQIAQVRIAKGMDGKIIRENKQVDFDMALKKGVMTSSADGSCSLSLGQKEVLRVDFHPCLRVYIRYTSVSTKAPKAVLFDFNEAELVGIGLACFFMLTLFFFVGIYYPRFLLEEEKLDEKVIRMATIQFKPPQKLKMARTAVKKQKKTGKENLPIRASKKSKKPVQIKKAGKKPGKMGAVVSRKKPQKKRSRKIVTSARQGSSPVSSKKGGSGARSPKPDPTKVGLLGVFGKGGIQKQLDKAYSGAGELGGLADQATGSSGTKETYSGKGYGTKFKDAGAGGKGSNLIGISGVSTRGQGGGTKGFGRGGGFGTRGSVNLSFGTSLIDVEGSIDREAILRVVRSNRAQLERCHSLVLQNNPSIQGRVKVRWVIQNDRVVSARVVTNESGSKTLAQCLVSRLKNWRFPGAVPRGASGEISFPFVFTGG